MKTAILIDGGYLRAVGKASGKKIDNKFIADFAHRCVGSNEYLYRIYYYDAAPFKGELKLPISGTKKDFTQSDDWLIKLGKLDRFAVRKGTLGFRGWTPKKIPVKSTALSDSDFKPNFEQKGVDMRIGLDIATLAEKRLVDRVVLVSGDTDMVAAMKHARKAGLEISVVQIIENKHPLHGTLLIHSDEKREVSLP